ncbi:MAG: hypothetical protein GC181_03615 [Bacteroidetes bacterium]|nr:hypothetical protein [Bacteroidota bacterium]
MKRSEKLVTVIPSRSGSNRVPMKGMRLLGDKTLIEYTIAAVKGSKYLSNQIYINSDGTQWGKLAEDLGVKYYHRRPELATSKSMIDDYLYDFMCNVEMDYLAVITPTAPFVSSTDLDNAWEAYAKSEANTVISAEAIQTHCFFNGSSLNFSTDGQLPRSQDLTPVHALNFLIAIYDCTFFKKQYEEKGYAVLGGKIDTFILDDFATIDIDEEKDFIMAELALMFQDKAEEFKPRYSKYVQDLIENKVNTKN